MTTVVLQHSISPMVRGALAILYVAIQNCMGCKAYRDMKLGLMDYYLWSSSTIAPQLDVARTAKDRFGCAVRLRGYIIGSLAVMV